MKQRNIKPPVHERNVESQRGKIRSDFPKHTLEQALVVAQTLETKNGGRPLPPTETAIALGVSPGSSEFRMLLSSSIKYGLTAGSYNQERVAVTELGRRIVESTSLSDRQAALFQSAFTPATFKSAYEYFRGKRLPEDEFFPNALAREFDVPKEHKAICAKILTANLRYLGLLREASTGLWVSTDAPEPQSQPAPVAPEVEAVEENNMDEPVDRSEVPTPIDHRKGTGAIFIGHGKNKAPLEQLKDLLNQYKIPYELAVEEANGFRPIPKKVADVMHKCDAAILIFTADTEFKDPQGQSIWKPSENVIYELGASSVLYGDKIIIFKEASVNFPTNFSGIGHITFEKDQLNAKVNELFKELIGFGLIKITVGA